MPSETTSSTHDRLQLALRATERQRAEYRSAVIAAHENAKAILAAGGGAERASLELGQFGGARIDAVRFAALDSPSSALDYASRSRIESAANVLSRLASVTDGDFVVDVPRGGDFASLVSRTLGALGRAFGAAAVVKLSRAGRFDETVQGNLLDTVGFELWGKSERNVAPPLVVRVAGDDLHAAALGDFLDGAMHIVLVVDGPCAPAPLVRLVTPGTFVLQTADATGVDLFSQFGGPAVMALVPASAARFIHEPTGGRATWQRLRVWSRPSELPRKSVGGFSPRQLSDELRQLDALAERPSLGDGPVETLVPTGSGDPTERLASWLLDASGLGGR